MARLYSFSARDRYAYKSNLSTFIQSGKKILGNLAPALFKLQLPPLTLLLLENEHCTRQKKENYGGQAVIEGVLMRSPRFVALAIRRKNGQVEEFTREVHSKFSRLLLSFPFIRGFFLLWDMLTYGLWGLNVSQDKYLEDLGERPAKQSTLFSILTIVFAFALALAVFKLLPTFAIDLLNKYLLPLQSTFWNNLLEASLRFSVFVGYIWAIGFIPEVRRLFMYHGAEHAAINAYEEEPGNLKPEVVIRKSRLHPRCGTSFIAILVIIGFVVYYVSDSILLELGTPAHNNWPIWWIRWPLRILLIPILAGVSYEVIKLTYALRKISVVKPVIYFGMLFQILTTRPPTLNEAGVAVCALSRVISQTAEKDGFP